jgi:hypothetical protein
LRKRRAENIPFIISHLQAGKAGQHRLIDLVGELKRPEWADQVIEKHGHYSERQAWYETNSREYGASELPPAGLLGPVRRVLLQEVEVEI